MLTDATTQNALAQELAEIMGPDEVKQRISELARTADKNPDKLKALELMAKVHALLTERNINENTNIDKTDLEAKAAELALEMFKNVQPSASETSEKVNNV
jgi:hypothetical protein